MRQSEDNGVLRPFVLTMPCIFSAWILPSCCRQGVCHLPWLTASKRRSLKKLKGWTAWEVAWVPARIWIWMVLLVQVLVDVDHYMLSLSMYKGKLEMLAKSESRYFLESIPTRKWMCRIWSIQRGCCRCCPRT
jgi:hypothetical protein